MKRGSIIALGMLCAAAPAWPAGGPAQVSPAGPAQRAPPAGIEAVYAAFIVNLTRFITWPEEALGAADAPFVIGTFPRDPINAELDAAARGETVGTHPVRTLRLSSTNDVRLCHVVFISRGAADPLPVLSRARQRPILTISDADGFLAAGGHIQFVRLPSRTRLQVSAENLKACGMEARSQLLRLAAEP